MSSKINLTSINSKTVTTKGQNISEHFFSYQKLLQNTNENISQFLPQPIKIDGIKIKIYFYNVKLYITGLFYLSILIGQGSHLLGFFEEFDTITNSSEIFQPLYISVPDI